MLWNKSLNSSKLNIIHTRTDENFRNAQPVEENVKDRVIYQQLHLIRSEVALKSIIDDWLVHKHVDLLLLVADASRDSIDSMHYIRVVVESEIRNRADDKKKFILLIHYPSLDLRSNCYPCLFSGAWNHIFLDSIGADEEFININQWIQLTCCDPGQYIKQVKSLKPTLEASLPGLLPRIALSKGLLYQEQLLPKDDSILSRVNYLTSVLNQHVEGDKRFMDCIIDKFLGIISQDYMIDLIRRASQVLIHGRSRVSMTLAISSAFAELFSSFLRMQLSIVNRWRNLDVVVNGNSSFQNVIPLFNKIFERFPQRSVEELRLHRFQRTDVPPPPAFNRDIAADSLFPFFHFVSSILNGVVQHALRDYRSIHLEEDGSLEMDVVHNVVEATTAMLNDRKLILNSEEVSYENSDRYFKLLLEVIETVQDDCQLHNLYIQQYARYYFLAPPNSIAFRYLNERVSLITETWKSLYRNIIVVHVIGNRDRMPLMKLGGVQERGKSLKREPTDPSSAISIDNWFHIRSINELCEDWLAALEDTQEPSRITAAVRESISHIPFLMASGIGKKSENSALQLRRLSLIYHIGQSELPDETLINVLRWVYSKDDMSLQCLFKILHDEKVVMNELMTSVIVYFLSPQWLLCVDQFFKDDLIFVMGNSNCAMVSFSALLRSVNKTMSPAKLRSHSLAFICTLCRAIPCDNLGEFNEEGVRIAVPRFVAPWARSNSTSVDPEKSLASSKHHESMDRAIRYISSSSCDYSSPLANDIFIVVLSTYSLEAERLQSNQIMSSILKDIDLEFSLSRKEQARSLRLRDRNEVESDYKGSPLAPIVIEAKIVCFICKMAEEVCHGDSPVLTGLYSETSRDFVEIVMLCDYWREFFLLYVIKAKGQGFLMQALSKGGPLHDLNWSYRWREGLPKNLQKYTEALSAAEKDHDDAVKDEESKGRRLRRCPQCQHLFEVHTMACGSFTCGRDVHQIIGRGGYGCGATFTFDSAPIYQPDQDRLDLSLRKRDEERNNFSRYQADASLWDQLQQTTLPIMVCRYATPSAHSGSLVPCAVFSDVIKKESYKFSLLAYAVDHAHTIVHFDLIPHLIEFYMWLQSTFNGLLSKEEASTLKMQNIMDKQKLKKRFDTTTVTHLLWLWDQVKSGVDRLIANQTFHIRWGCEEVPFSFTNIEEGSLLSLISAKDEPTEDTDFLFLGINHLIETYNGFALKYNQYARVECEDEIHPTAIMNGSMYAAAISSLSVMLSGNVEFLVENSWRRWSDDFDLEKISSHLLRDLSNSTLLLPVKPPVKYLRERFDFRREDARGYDELNKFVQNCGEILFAHSHDYMLFQECVTIVDRNEMASSHTHVKSNCQALVVFYSADYRTLRSLLEGIKTVLSQPNSGWRSYQKLGDMIVSIGGSTGDSVLAQLGFPPCSQSQREYVIQIDRKELKQFIHAIGYQLASESFNYAHLPLYVHSPLDADAQLLLQTNITNKARRLGTKSLLLAIEEFLTSMKNFENVIVTNARDPKFINTTFIHFFESSGVYDDTDPIFSSLPKHATLRNYAFICQELNQNKLRLWTQTETNACPQNVEISEENVGYALLWKKGHSTNGETNPTLWYLDPADMELAVAKSMIARAHEEPIVSEVAAALNDAMEVASDEEFFDCLDASEGNMDEESRSECDPFVTPDINAVPAMTEAFVVGLDSVKEEPTVMQRIFQFFRR